MEKGLYIIKVVTLNMMEILLIINMMEKENILLKMENLLSVNSKQEKDMEKE